MLITGKENIIYTVGWRFLWNIRPQVRAHEHRLDV